MKKIKKVAVFCSSSNEVRPEYKKLARKLGARLGAEGFDLVFGGGDQGLMGIVAEAAYEAGSNIIGITTEHLVGKENDEHHFITEICPDMHERKRRMFEEADALINIAGGFGTLDEMFEVMTLRQIGEWDKPIFYLDTPNAFFLEIIKGMINTMIYAKTIKEEDKNVMLMTTSMSELFKHLHGDKVLEYKSRY